MFTRVVQRKRPRKAAFAVLGATIIVASGLIASAALATIPPPPADSTCTGVAPGQAANSVEVANNNASADCTTTDGALVSYIGSNDTVRQSSGTGLFDPFVRLQADGDEEGYNTCSQNQCGGDVTEFDTKVGTWTHAILVSAIPIVNIGGTNYWELFVDINDKNSSKPISLNTVEIYFAPGPGGANITGYPGFAGFSATLKYQFVGEIKINDVNSGSGRGDLRYLVPLTNIQPFPAGAYFVLYSKWGTTSGYASDGGFEEWKVRKAPSVSIVKTADAASVNAGSPIGFTVTVTNSGAADATGVTVNDPLPGGTGVDWSIDSQNPAGSCSISGSPATSETLTCGPLTLASGGGQLTVHVTSNTTAASCGTYNNTASFTSTNAGSGSSSASTAVNCAAIKILKQSTKTVGGSPVLVANEGAVFSITGPGGYTNSVTDDNAAAVEDEDTTIGEVCISGLAPGDYTVNETTPPTGYGAATQTNLTATAAVGTNCTTNEPTAANSATFTNAPLYDLQVNFRDGGSGETSATISCTNTGTADTTAATDWDTTNTFLGEAAPETVVCTIVVDP